MSDLIFMSMLFTQEWAAPESLTLRTVNAMKTKDHIVTRIIDGAKRYLSNTGWSDLRRCARRYYKEDARHLAYYMSCDRDDDSIYFEEA